eukprot:tig00020780_g13818.t1
MARAASRAASAVANSPLESFLCRPAPLRYGDFEVTPRRAVPEDIRKPPYARARGAGRPVPVDAMRSVPRAARAEDLPAIRKAAATASSVLKYAGTLVRAGVTTDAIDAAVHDAIVQARAYPSPLLYMGFPKSVCTSVNEVVCHGIPDLRPLQDGDIVKIDVSCYTADGFHGDTCGTFTVGEVDGAARRLVDAAREALDRGIRVCRPGQPFRAIGDAIQGFTDSRGLAVCAAFTGHGLGREFHTAPIIHHRRNSDPGEMAAGMVFTIEPAVSERSDSVSFWPDGWTAVNDGGDWSAQFEHTVLITHDGCEVLTRHRGG